MNWGMDSFLEKVAAPCAKLGSLWAILHVGGQNGEVAHWFHRTGVGRKDRDSSRGLFLIRDCGP